MNALALLALLTAAASLLPQAQAQGVWRCGADGRQFSDRPCSDGQPLPMAALSAEPSAAQRLEALDVAAREQRLADELRRQRLQRERAADPPTYRHAAAQRHRDTGVRPQVEAKSPRATPSRRATAAAGTWPAADRASRRTKD
jgi:hypothetical protein